LGASACLRIYVYTDQSDMSITNTSSSSPLVAAIGELRFTLFLCD
jgi:hypothetical protein